MMEEHIKDAFNYTSFDIKTFDINIIKLLRGTFLTKLNI